MRYLQFLTVIYLKTPLLFTTSQGFYFRTFFSSSKYAHFGFSDYHTLTSAGLRSVLQRSAHSFIHSFIHSGHFYNASPNRLLAYSEALPTQHGYCAGVSRRSATGNCELRTCPRSLRDG